MCFIFILSIYYTYIYIHIISYLFIYTPILGGFLALRTNWMPASLALPCLSNDKAVHDGSNHHGESHVHDLTSCKG